MIRIVSRCLLSGVLWSTAVGCVSVSLRLRGMGSWLPEMPARVGDWVATETPLSLETRSRLGNPRARSMVYRNAHGESVVVHALAPKVFQGFGELAPIEMDYKILARQSRPLSGLHGAVSASAYESIRTPGLVLHALRWIQTPSGRVFPFEPDVGSNPVARLRRGFELLTRDPQACAVHVTTMTSPDGAGAGQVRRNVHEIALGVLSYASRQREASR